MSSPQQCNILGHIVPDIIIGGNILPFKSLINILSENQKKQNIKEGLLFGGGWGASAHGRD